MHQQKMDNTFERPGNQRVLGSTISGKSLLRNAHLEKGSDVDSLQTTLGQFDISTTSRYLLKNCSIILNCQTFFSII
jgi:hypothetical protein